MPTRKPLYLGTNGTPTEMNLSDDLPVGLLPELTELAVPAKTLLTAQWPGDVIQYDGTLWRNMPLATGSPGSAGAATFYNASPTLLTSDSQNSLPLHTLSRNPVTSGELTASGTATLGVSPIAAWLSSTPLGRQTIPAGLWTFTLYGGVDSVADERVTWATRRLFEVIAEPMSLTTTGSGSTRTATAISGTPFASGDAHASPETAHYLQTPKGLYQITGYTSPTVATITVPSGYVNETAVAWNKWRGLFASSSFAFTSVPPTYMQQTWDSLQDAFAVAASSKLGSMDYVVAAYGGPTTLTLLYDGYTDITRNSRITSTMTAGETVDHAALTGLQGGGSGQHYHLTAVTHTAVNALTTTQIGYLASAQLSSLVGLTTTQVGALSGVTSAIQTQLDGKQATLANSGALAGLTATQIAAMDILTTTKMASLTSTALSGLTTAQLSGLTPALVTVLQQELSIGADYTLALADAGKLLYHPGSDTTARTLTVPAHASVAFPVGTTFHLVNDGAAGALHILVTTDTLRISSLGVTGNASIQAEGSATLVKVAATRWVLYGSGVSPYEVTTFSGGTESTAGGYRYITFPSSGTFTYSSNITNRTLEWFLLGAGGAGGAGGGGGGGGGGIKRGSLTNVSSLTVNITVGTGAAGVSGNVVGGKGGDSTLSGGITATALGGNGGAGGNGVGASGGACGGGGSTPSTHTLGASGYGDVGGTANAIPNNGAGGDGAPDNTGGNLAAGGGGGAGGHGQAPPDGNTGGAGGPGVLAFAGTSDLYGAGGGGTGATTGGQGGSSIGGTGGTGYTVAGASGTRGSGGGGTHTGNSGGGGNGIWIIRWLL
ncbi:MAG: hypothetical protein H7837_13295 [Magnetococcus sp. MYC-9]